MKMLLRFLVLFSCISLSFTRTSSFKNRKQCASDSTLEPLDSSHLANTNNNKDNGWRSSEEVTTMNIPEETTSLNYVWPMESAERMFFFLRGMGMLLNGL